VVLEQPAKVEDRCCELVTANIIPVEPVREREAPIGLFAEELVLVA
jgi:hypothetical protein